MSLGIEQLERWMSANEDEHLEFKEAKNHYHFDNLVKYCAALANEGGGHMIFGITNKPPREVVGSKAFQQIERTVAGLVQRLRLKIEGEEIFHADKRILVFSVPSRPIGVAIEVNGAYWMRAGEDLVPMTQDQLKKIILEEMPDFSSELCTEATVSDLEPEAIERFRSMWLRKSRNQRLQQLTYLELLTDAEVIVDDKLTYAALILFGKRLSLGKYLANSEVILEYRSNEASLPAQQRHEYRQGFFLYHDELWEKINLRNDVQQYHDGLFARDIPTFSEEPIREAILNAVCHRDYQLSGSIFIKQFPKKLEIISPGGFPPGISAENILWKQSPRNRRLAEIFAKCGLVERSGQGANRMFEQSIKESKPLPDFSGTDNYQVFLTLRGEVQDVLFLKFLEKVGKDTLESFTTRDLLVLDLIHREQKIPAPLQERLNFLREKGIIETIGRGRGSHHMLSQKLYSFIGKSGVYSRKRGLDRPANLAILLEHLSRSGSCGMQNLQQVLPHLSRDQITSLLRSLRKEGKIRCTGQRRWAQWEMSSSKVADLRGTNNPGIS